MKQSTLYKHTGECEQRTMCLPACLYVCCNENLITNYVIIFVEKTRNDKERCNETMKNSSHLMNKYASIFKTRLIFIAHYFWRLQLRSLAFAGVRARGLIRRKKQRQQRVFCAHFNYLCFILLLIRPPARPPPLCVSPAHSSVRERASHI